MLHDNANPEQTQEGDVCPICGMGELVYPECGDEAICETMAKECGECSFHYLQCDYCEYTEE